MTKKQHASIMWAICITSIYASNPEELSDKIAGLIIGLISIYFGLVWFFGKE